MKRQLSMWLLVILFFLLCGCRKTAEGEDLNMPGMNAHSQINRIEQCLSIDLEDLTDDLIETIYSGVNSEGNRVCVQYISLEGAGEVVAPRIEQSKRWTALPLPAKIDDLLSSNSVYDSFAFEDIEEGYYTVSGVLANGEEFDFDQSHLDVWVVYEIGIWDLHDETLYYISITKP